MEDIPQVRHPISADCEKILHIKGLELKAGVMMWCRKS